MPLAGIALDARLDTWASVAVYIVPLIPPLSCHPSHTSLYILKLFWWPAGFAE
jgi:hypothetical protein